MQPYQTVHRIKTREKKRKNTPWKKIQQNHNNKKSNSIQFNSIYFVFFICLLSSHIILHMKFSYVVDSVHSIAHFHLK